jgi:putative NADH-flavin reductase
LRVLVIGASRGIGQEVVNAALVAGHHVRAFARSAGLLEIHHSHLEAWCGDARRQEDIASALNGIDTVVQVLGVRERELFQPVRLFSAATRVLVPQMERLGVRRLIAVTGFGAGDSDQAISLLQRVPFRLLLGRAYDDKSVQEQLIKDSPLDWTIVRPGVLVPGPATGRYKVLAEPRQWRNGIISRANVAHFIVREIVAGQFIRRAPVLVTV